MAVTMMGALKDREGFNPVYMMADSGAKGSQDRVQLAEESLWQSHKNR